MSKKSILKGTLILTITGILTKLMGFYNRIFLTRLIGVKELGIYQLIFPIYILALSFSCQGISLAITKQLSYFLAKKDTKSAKKVFLFALSLALSLSIISSFFINKYAYSISLSFLKNTDCYILLKIISYAIPFVSIKGCINAYFMAIDKPLYHGMSHLFEQIIRILSVYILSILWSVDKISSVLAVTSVVIGEFAAFLIAIVIYVFSKKRKSTICNNSKNNQKGLYKNFLRDSIPITGTNLFMTLFSSLETIILPAMLYKYYGDGDMVMFIYGNITGIVIPFLLFPSTITTSLSTMLVPAVSYAKAQNHKSAINNAISRSIAFCFILGIITCLGYMIIGNWACCNVFQSSDAGKYLIKMCYLCPFIYISGNMSAILNGLGMAFNNLLYNLISIIIRIFFIVFLVPQYGIGAYILGMCISYGVIDGLLYLCIHKYKRNA